MSHHTHIATRNGVQKTIGGLIVASAAFLAVSAGAPATAAAHDLTISALDIEFGDSEDLLEQLIELDADDIQELREEMAEALEEIDDAMDEIEDAREEAKSAPGGGAILKVAFGAASVAITESVDKAFEKVRSELDTAEGRLSEMKSTLGPEEFAETQEAIGVIRAGLADIEAALDELVAALNA
ncbi:MAG: hypothetical protein ACE5FO_10110 [Parvularculaceae bacterium]